MMIEFSDAYMRHSASILTDDDVLSKAPLQTKLLLTF